MSSVSPKLERADSRVALTISASTTILAIEITSEGGRLSGVMKPVTKSDITARWDAELSSEEGRKHHALNSFLHSCP